MTGIGYGIVRLGSVVCSSWQSFLQERPYATAYWPFSVMESCTSNANPPTFEFIENQWFEVGGWHIRKALRLQRKSNATLLEWLRSPIINTQDDDFTGRLNALAPQYVQAVGWC